MKGMHLLSTWYWNCTDYYLHKANWRTEIGFTIIMVAGQKEYYKHIFSHEGAMKSVHAIS